MSDPAPSPIPASFGLTPRQRTLRRVTLMLLLIIAIMIGFGMMHPFFHLHPPHVMTPTVRKALAVRGLLILFYWTICLLLACSLVFVAWLDLREVRLRMLMARRDIWRNMAGRSRQDDPPER